MTEQEIIAATAAFVEKELEGAEAGHDWWHIQRVWQNAKAIAKHENVNHFIVELGALLHDIADSKFHGGDEEVGPRKAAYFLQQLQADDEVIKHVENIIRNISFKGGNFERTFHSPELAVVQDADRLDALGAIGIARAFNFGGYKNREFYNPSKKPLMGMDKETYKNNEGTTINHFYEKLLLLKDRMNTKTATEMAQQRHDYMEGFLDQFFAEWNGER